MAFKEIAKDEAKNTLFLSFLHITFRFFYSFTYRVSPYTAHRIVGYLEEFAIKTYTEFLEDIKKGIVKNVPAPQIAIHYWGLPKDADYEDLVTVIRADEGDHRKVNHKLAKTIKESKVTGIKPSDHFDVDYSEDLGPGISDNIKKEYEQHKNDK